MPARHGWADNMVSLQEWIDGIVVPAFAEWVDLLLAGLTVAPAFAAALLFVSVMSGIVAERLSVVAASLIFSAVAIVLYSELASQTLKNGLFAFTLLGYAFLMFALLGMRRQHDRTFRRLEAERTEKDATKLQLEQEIKWRKASE